MSVCWYIMEIKKLKFKYQEYTVVPCDVTPDNGIYETSDGIQVELSIRGKYDNTDGRSEETLKQLSRVFFNLPFDTVNRVWNNRLGYTPTFWAMLRLCKK